MGQACRGNQPRKGLMLRLLLGGSFSLSNSAAPAVDPIYLEIVRRA